MNVEVIGSRYVKSESISSQGKWSKVKRYKERGYKPTVSNNGYYLFTKPADLLLTLECENERCEVSFRGKILDYYGRERLTERLADTFIKDLKSGVVRIKESDGEFFIG